MIASAAAMRPLDGPGLQTQRRAVLIVDVVESAHLLRADPTGYVARWRSLVNATREQILPAHGGKFVKSLGDGMLVHFEAATAAVSSALALQHLAACGAEPALQLRAGISMAELVADDLDVYGDGVNLAARLAALASPGDIVVSDDVRGELVHGVQLQITDMGMCYLKHYPEAVRAFCVRSSHATPTTHLAPPADLRTIVAVCPLVPMAPDAQAQMIGLALADDVIAALTRCPGLRVIARASTQALAGGGVVRPEQAGRYLDASYLLTGTLLRREGQARVRVQLSETASGEVIWADGLTLEVASLFIGEDACVPRIVQQVGDAIMQRELRRARALPVSSLSSYSLMTAGIALLHRLRQNEFERAHHMLERLADLEPRSPAPHALLAKWQLLHVAQGWEHDAARAASRAHDHVRRALDQHVEHGLALSLLAHLQAQAEDDLDTALDTARRAVLADPQEPNAWLIASGVHGYRGEGTAAVAHAEAAIRLSPLDPARFLFDAFLANALLVDGRYDDATTAAESAVAGNALHPASLRLLAACAELAGRRDTAQRAAARLLCLNPGFSVGAFASRHPGRHQAYAERQAEALRAAGLPA